VIAHRLGRTPVSRDDIGMRVAFDSRPSADPRGVGRYARCLLRALRDTAGTRGEIVETHRPRRADVYHAPWMQGAILHSPCPMVVTIHDLDALTRTSERLRSGGIHLRLRHLAVQRASARPRSRRRTRIRARACGRDTGGARSHSRRLPALARSTCVDLAGRRTRDLARLRKRPRATGTPMRGQAQ